MVSGANASDIIREYTQLLRRPLATPEVAVSVLSDALPVRDTRPCALILSPHPDDECLTGGLALRLKRELGWQIINVAVTLGSNGERQAARQAELSRACAVLGFDCALPVENGFSDVTVRARDNDNTAWTKKVARIADIIAHTTPQAVIMPHAHDAHPAHIGTHHLGMEALVKQKNDFECKVIHTEYWQPQAEPNLMIGLGETDVAALLSALVCHVGENSRNAFDARFPAYLIDNVRRGSERVGGAGVASAPMDFAMLYKFGVWKNNKFIPSALPRMIGATESLAELVEV